MIITQEYLLSKVLQYLQCPWVLPYLGLQTSYNYCPSATPTSPLMLMLAICTTSKCLPTILYHLQHIVSTHSHYLPPIALHYHLQAATCWYSPPSLYHQVLVITFVWQPIIYYSINYQVICIFTLCFKINVEIPSQGTTYLV